MKGQLPRKLNASFRPAEQLQAISCALEESTTAVPKATLTLPPGAEPLQIHELVELFVGEESHGYFRVVSSGVNLRNQITHQLMGAADTLTDDVWAAQVAETTYTPAALFTAALTHQSVQRWQKGRCDAAVSVKTAISYDDIWTVLEKIRTENPDCMWQYDYTTTPWTLSLVKMQETIESELRIGRNIESATINITDKEMCNRLYMTVTSDNSSTLVTAENTESINKYGVVVKLATVTAQEAPNPQAYAAAILAERAEPIAYISIGGLDLKEITGDEFDRVKLGTKCRAVIPEYSETPLSERVVAKKWPDIIHEPERVTVSLANAIQTFSENLQFIRRTASSARSSASKTEKDLTHWEQIVTAQQTALDDLGITGLWQSGLVLDAYQGVKIWSSEQGVNSYLAQIAINSTSINQAVEAVGLEWDETANEGAGGWVPSASPAAGSVAARLALIPGQISAAATAVENNISARGYITAQAATNAAKAVIGASLLDENTGKLSVAEIVAAVNNSGSSVVINADHVDVNGILTATKLNTSDGYAGTLYAQEFKGSTLTASTLKLASSGNTYDTVSRKAVRVGNTLLANLTLLGTGSDTALDIPNAYTAIKVVSDGNNGYKLQGKTVTNDSWADIPNTSFSRATTLSGAWSGDVYTITASPQGNTFTATLAKGAVTTAPTIATPVTLTLNNPAVANSETTKTLTVSVQYPGISSSNSSVDNVTQLPANATSSYTVYPYVNVDGTVYYSSGIAIDTSLVYQAGQGAGAGAVTLTMADEEAVYLSGVSASVNVTASKDGGTTTQGHTVRVTNLAIDTSTYANGVYTLAPSFTMGGDDHTKTINWTTSTLDISAKLTAATTDGKNSAKVTGPTWATTPASGITVNSNTATFTTDADTPVSGAAKSLALYLSQGSWSNNKKYVYAHHTSSTDGNRIARIEVDASTLVSNAENTARAQAVTDATLSVDTPYLLNGVIKIYPRVTFDQNTEKSANPMDAQRPGVATNSSGTPTPASSPLASGSTVYPYVQIGTEYFYGSAVTVQAATAQQLMKVVKADNQIVLASDGTLSTVTIGKPAISSNAPANTLPNVITTLTPGQTFYPHVKVGNDYFYGDAITAPSGGSGDSIDVIAITNNPVPASLVTISNARYVQGTASLAAYHDDNSGSGEVMALDELATDTSTVRMNIESILSSAESTAQAEGKASVTLNDPTWNTVSGDPPSNRTVTVSTSGRTDSSGTTENLSKSVSLYLTSSGLTVSMRTNSASGTVYAKTTCSDANLTAGNIKDGVTIFGVTGSYTGSNVTYTQATVTLQGEAETVYVQSATSGTNYYEANEQQTWYRGNGGENTVQGTAGPKLRLSGTRQLYYLESGTYKKIGSDDTTWYYESTSGTQYYNAGTTTVYGRGGTITVTPINSSSMKKLTTATRYKQGTTDSTTYYTRNS